MQVPRSEWTNIWVDSLVLLCEGAHSIPIQLIILHNMIAHTVQVLKPLRYIKCAFKM